MTGTRRADAGPCRRARPRSRHARCPPAHSGARSAEGARMDLKALIGQAATGAALTREQASIAFDAMMSGEATPSQMGGLLMALRVRGETIDEITGAVSAMRSKMLPVIAPPDAVDVVGTGGDASGSYNISTCAAFIVAGPRPPGANATDRPHFLRSGADDLCDAVAVDVGYAPDPHRPLSQ